MMPIFFNFASHVWLLYFLFFNGLLCTYLICQRSAGFRKLIIRLEDKVLAAFCFSVGVNGFLGLIFVLLELRFSFFVACFGIVSTSLVVGTIFMRDGLTDFFRLSWDWRVLVYLFVGVVAFYNGALIEQISDAWWHMSKANAIATNELIWGQVHLNGVTNRWYPPLWHTNLAIVHRLSGQSLPVLWNSATLWLSVTKVMAYYSLAFALTRAKSVAFLAIILFLLLPGMGVSYLRVSAWPSHVAYLMMFFALGLCFRILDAAPGNIKGLRSELTHLFKEQYILIAFLLFVLTLMFFTHQLEVLWFAVAVSLYSLAASCWAQCTRSLRRERLGSLTRLFAIIFLIAVSGMSFRLLTVDMSMASDNIDRAIAHMYFVIVPLVLLATAYITKAKYKLLCYAACAVPLVISIDLQHCLALFNPQFSLPKPAYHEMPLLTRGWFGGDLRLPDWDLQLRGALLWSGIVALPLIVFQQIQTPTRENLFLAVTGAAALGICVSPYVYQWLSDVTGYHSPWRIVTLLFTPLIFSLTIHRAFYGAFFSAPRSWRVQ